MKWRKRGGEWFLSRTNGVEVLAHIYETPELAYPFHGETPDGRKFGDWTLKALKAQIELAVTS